MAGSPLPGLLVKPFDIALELLAVHSPHTPSPDLHRGEVAGADQGVHLGDAHVEVASYVLERHEARLGDPLLTGIEAVHRPKIASQTPRSLDWPPFAVVRGLGPGRAGGG